MEKTTNDETLELETLSENELEAVNGGVLVASTLFTYSYSSLYNFSSLTGAIAVPSCL